MAALVGVFSLPLLIAVGTRADLVDDGQGAFSHVTIVGIEDDQLVFVFNDGRSVQRRVDRLARIEISPGNDVAADELTRAEALRQHGKRGDALGLYLRVATMGGRPWVRDFAVMRQAMVYDELGDLRNAFEAYCRLAVSHPRLAERVRPRRIPREDSQQCRKVLSVIEERLQRPQPEALAGAMKRMREAILRRGETPSDEDAGWDAAESANGAPGASRVPDALAPIREALRRGNLAEALKELEAARRGKGGDRPAVRLLEAELAMAKGDARRAGLLAMQVLARDAEGVEAPRALFIAGESQERIGRTYKALRFYRRCAEHARTEAELKRQAEQRVAALTRGAAATSAPTTAPS